MMILINIIKNDNDDDEEEEEVISREEQMGTRWTRKEKADKSNENDCMVKRGSGI